MKSFSLVLLVFLIFAALPARAEEPVYSIENVTGDLYRFQSNDYYGVFLVTDEGIILVDPISTATATWLKGELDNRFGKNVIVVIYSHHHADHISGGEVFLDTAQLYIAHEKAKEKIIEEGVAVPPTTTFKQGTYVELGGKRVNFYASFMPHTHDLISIYFEEAKALYLSDVFYVDSIFWEEFEKTYISSTITLLDNLLENLDFEIAIPSHGAWGDRQDLIAYKEFVNALNNAVSPKMVEGKTLEQIKAEISTEEFQKWPAFLDVLPQAIEANFNRYYNGEYYPLVKVYPTYPRLAARDGICGWVMVEYDIKADGTTENVRIFESEPGKVFDRVAIKAAKKYRYFARTKVVGVRTRIYFGLKGACHWEFK